MPDFSYPKPSPKPDPLKEPKEAKDASFYARPQPKPADRHMPSRPGQKPVPERLRHPNLKPTAERPSIYDRTVRKRSSLIPDGPAKSDGHAGATVALIAILVIAILSLGGFFAYHAITLKADDNGEEAVPNERFADTSSNFGGTANVEKKEPEDRMLTFDRDNRPFTFSYPKDHRVVENGDLLSIVPMPTEGEPTPLPVMTIRVSDSSIEEVIRAIEEGAMREVVEVSDVTINGLPGKRVDVRYDYYDGKPTLPTYLLGTMGSTYIFNLYEGLEWRPFEEVVRSFRADGK